MLFSSITRTLITLNVAVFALIYYISPALISSNINVDDYMNNIVKTWGLLPAYFLKGAIWQPITSMFIHGSGMHLLFNMIALWSLGEAIEKTIGARRYVYLYFFSGLCGAAMVIFFQSDPGIPTIGASGAVMGLLGALAIFYPNSYLLLFFIPMKARTAAFVFGIGSVVYALMDNGGGISHLSHIGGLAGGIIFSRFFLNLSIFNSKLHHPKVDPKFSRGVNINDPENKSKDYEVHEMKKVVYFDSESGQYYVRYEK